MIISTAQGDVISDPAVSYMFKLSVDNQELGLWNSFEGLGMESSIETREEGGNNVFVHQLPGRLKYTNIKVSRPLGRDTTLVATWFAGMASDEVKRTTARICALGPDHREIASWSLDGVVPVRWTGPVFNVESPKVATETLELAYHGFLEVTNEAAKADASARSARADAALKAASSLGQN